MTKTFTRRQAAGLVTAAVGGLALPGRLTAQDSFYAGKTIELIIPAGPGGFDFIGRLVARHLTRHIPGSPEVIPRNMPGAGGLVATNYIYNKAARDGLVIAQLGSTVLIDSVLKPEGVQFDAREFSYIGRFAKGLFITVAAPAVGSIDDAKSREVNHASTGKASIAYQLPNLLNALTGTKLNLISGYTDSASTMLAIEKGEAEAATVSYNSLTTLRPDWMDKDKATILVQYTHDRQPQLPDVPALMELLTNEADKPVAELFLTTSQLGQYFNTPPGVPPELIEILRRAYEGLFTDEAFLAEVAAAKLAFDPLSGEELQKVALGTTEVAPAVIERARVLRE